MMQHEQNSKKIVNLHYFYDNRQHKYLDRNRPISKTTNNTEAQEQDTYSTCK